MRRALGWVGIFLASTCALSFLYDIYSGNPATWPVWAFAFLGLMDWFVDNLEMATKN